MFEMFAATSVLAMTTWIAAAEYAAPIVHFNIRLVTWNLEAMSSAFDGVDRESPKPPPRGWIPNVVA